MFRWRMKCGALAAIIALSINAISGCGTIFGNRETVRVSYTELGRPSAENYSKGSHGLYIHDMAVFNGVLYIGDGDYNINTGPTSVMACRITDGEWFSSGRVDEEAVCRFLTLNGALAVPGVDPTDGWQYGNYYVLSDTGWEKTRSIPGGIHNFDMIEYGGRLFAAIGANAGEHPVAYSEDGGQSFYNVPMYKDEKPFETSSYSVNRCYEFFLLKDELYVTYVGVTEDGAKLEYALFKYADDMERFVYFSNLSGNLVIRNISENGYISDRCVFKDTAYAATGYLGVSTDMEKFTTVRFPNDDVVHDVTVYGDALYILCSRETDEGKYEISVWRNESGKLTDMEKLFYFEYDIPAVSFVYDGECFYFGMFGAKDEKNGMVLAVSSWEK